MESLTGIIKTYTEIPSIDLSKDGEINEKNHSRQFTAHYQNGPTTSSIGIFYLDGKTNRSYNQKLPFNDFTSENHEIQEVENIALFGEVTFQILPRWSIFGGLRYDREELGFNKVFREINETQLLSSTSFSSDFSDDAILPKVGINHNLNKDTLISLKTQKSYRPGGIEYDLFNNNDYLYNDETVWNYELSLSGKLPNKSINYSANLFYMDWKDQQLTIPRIPGDLTSSVVTNVKDS